MRIKGLATVLFAGLVCAGLVVADDESQPGGDIQATEHLHQEIILTATTNAPPGATGKAELEAETDDATNTATFAVEVGGLLPGTYAVSVTKKSDGSTVQLGTFDVGETDTNDALVFNVMGDDNGQSGTVNEAESGTEEALAPPHSPNPMDIASVSISDSNGDLVLTGNFADAADMMSGLFKAKVAVAAGPAAPNASGLAVVQSKVKRGAKQTKFRLLATGASPNEVLILKINGTDVGTVTADQHGRIRLKSLPTDVDPESLILMEFDDSDGTNAMTISF